MRHFFRLNVLKGSGKRADVPGYSVGGKTGTAEKVESGRYSGNKRRNVFLAGFPDGCAEISGPGGAGRAEVGEAGHGRYGGPERRAAVGNIVRRIAPDAGHGAEGWSIRRTSLRWRFAFAQ